jgi:hypothetical protein
MSNSNESGVAAMPGNSALDGTSGSNGSPAPTSEALSPTGNARPPTPPTKIPRYHASFFPGAKREIPREFGELVGSLENTLAMPVWLLVQNGEHDYGSLSNEVKQAFLHSRAQLPNEKVALLIESPGGNADCAYQVARLLQRKCGGFTAIVGANAKSAATLLCLGADEIVMSADAQLGPLDAQFFDRDRDAIGSALDHVQALERLNAASLECIDQTVLLLLYRTGKKVDVILPHALRFVADSMRPLFEKIDAVQYCQRSRMLKVAEEYAKRLLRAHQQPGDVDAIASRLVENYPEHAFVIDPEEAKNLGLNVRVAENDTARILDAMARYLSSVTAIGRVTQQSQPSEG